MSTMADDGLFARNMDAIERHAPGLAKRLRALGTPEAHLTGSLGDGDLNLDLGHTRLYEPDGPHFVETQLANFQRRPTRMFINLPKIPAVPELVPHHVLLPVVEHFREMPFPAFPSDPHEPAGFMIVYGIGLGLHLPALVSECRFRHLILVEQFPEFILHSLHAVDWAAWLETLYGRGGTVRFLIGQDPAHIAHRLYWDLRGAQFGLIDGTYVYKHYNSFLLDKAEELFREKLPVLGVAAGFFEDEEKMMRNSFANLLDCDYSLLEPKPRLEKPVPALIVGSGPSIDSAIEEVRRLREHAVLISCGTALGVLLRNGIKPDFHCEMENHISTWEHLSNYRSWTDFDGITLVASTTVDPLVPGLFDKRIFYFRDSVSSTGFFGKPFNPIYGGAPTVTNLGLRIAFTLGFKEAYLFGVDLGTRDRAQHHSKDTFYLTDETWKQTYTKEIEPMVHELPANFGGLAYTNRVLLWARLMMSGILEMYADLKVFNCSDGVQIPRATPRLARSVKLTTTEAQRVATIERIRHEIVPKRPGELIDGPSISVLRDEFAGFFAALSRIVETARAEGWEFLPFHDAVDALLEDAADRRWHGCIRTVSHGTFMTILQCGYFFARRAPPEQRPVFMRIFLDSLGTVVSRMAQEVDGWLDGFLSRLDRREAA